MLTWCLVVRSSDTHTSSNVHAVTDRARTENGRRRQREARQKKHGEHGLHGGLVGRWVGARLANSSPGFPCRKQTSRRPPNSPLSPRPATSIRGKHCTGGGKGTFSFSGGRGGLGLRPRPFLSLPRAESALFPIPPVNYYFLPAGLSFLLTLPGRSRETFFRKVSGAF